MRCTQPIGLTDEAENFITLNVKTTPEETCSECNHTTGGELVKRVYDASGSSGMFGDGPSLHEYELKDGSKVKEIVQTAPWSSGPMIFLCLEDEEGKRLFEWKQDEDLKSEVDQNAGTFWV